MVRTNTIVSDSIKFFKGMTSTKRPSESSLEHLLKSDTQRAAGTISNITKKVS